MKVGVVVPCHNSDADNVFKFCHASLRKLNPAPGYVMVDFNDGKIGLKGIITFAFDELFYSHDCDVVLKASADFYLSPHILKHVDRDHVVSFTPLAKKPFDLWFALHRLLLPSRTWSGCYSIPKKVWSQVRSQFDGSDTSVARAAGVWRVKSFQYQLLRPYRVETTRKLLKGFPLWKRVLWQLVRMKAVRLNE